MSTAGEVWQALGELNEEEALHTLTRLFSHYETRLQRDPEDEAATLFLTNLFSAIKQSRECNLNRR